uniref:Uncharacterized protein n=1 Tax=Panagrolaimus sp. JU765 TaxID=591449 RepID=A0AC34RQJ1_9BILA
MLKNTGKFAGKTILITGASRGIGKEIGLKLAKDGANIVIAAKTAEPHPKLPGTIFTAADEMYAAGGRGLPCVVDVRDEKSVDKCVDAAVAEFGGIDILINNASAISVTDTLSTEMKRYDLMHQINLRGSFLMAKKCIPYLKKAENPHILTMSPPLNMDPKWFGSHVAYTISKYEEDIIEIKRYDPNIKAYKVFYINQKSSNTSSTGSQTLPIAPSPIPRILSPAPSSRQYKPSDGSLTTEDYNNASFIRGPESIRSTGSEWKYTATSSNPRPNRVYQTSANGTTFAVRAPEEQQPPTLRINPQGYFEPVPPPKPVRAVDPEFLQTGEEQMAVLRSGQQRKSRRTRGTLPNRQRKMVRSHPAPRVIEEYEEEYESDVEAAMENGDFQYGMKPSRKMQSNYRVNGDPHL